MDREPRQHRAASLERLMASLSGDGDPMMLTEHGAIVAPPSRPMESPCWQHADEVTCSDAEIRCDDCDTPLMTTCCAGCGRWFVTGPHVLSWDGTLQCVPCWEKMYLAEDIPDA